MCFLTVKEDCILIDLRVVPNSSKVDLVNDSNRIRFKITAPPVDNKANKFILEYFSKQFRLAKSSIKIVKGELSKDKTIMFIVEDKTKQNNIVEFFNTL